MVGGVVVGVVNDVVVSGDVGKMENNLDHDLGAVHCSRNS